METYKTPLADVFVLDNGIHKEVWNIKELTDLEIVQTHLQITTEESRKRGVETLLILIDATNVKKISKPVRDFLEQARSEPIPSAIALLLRSALSRIIGTLFLKFNKPVDFPMKLFPNEDKAINWLLGNKN